MRFIWEVFTDDFCNIGLSEISLCTGAIIGAVKQGKKTIAVPRLSKYGEHVDDHQVQIVEQFTDMKLLEPCWDVEFLEQAYTLACKSTYMPYVSNTRTIIASIEEYLEKNI